MNTQTYWVIRSKLSGQVYPTLFGGQGSAEAARVGFCPDTQFRENLELVEVRLVESSAAALPRCPRCRGAQQITGYMVSLVVRGVCPDCNGTGVELAEEKP